MDETRAAEVELALLRAGRVEVVDPTSQRETDAWTACDLASMVEGCFRHTLDPWTLSDGERQHWLDRLGDSYEVPDPALDRAFLRYLWLLDEGERVGTMALPLSAIGRIDLPLWSLYVHPVRRRRGIAAAALKATHDAARTARLRSIHIETHWIWQRSVRFYLGQRMWVEGWKRALSFVWPPDLPRYDVMEDETRIVLTVHDGEPWLSATRDGDRLVLDENGALSSRYGWIYAHATMATLLATRGWPLIRLAEDWANRNRSVDVGRTEGLALKIQIFEALAHEWGWEVETPRIPGLTYPPLGAL